MRTTDSCVPSFLSFILVSHLNCLESCEKQINNNWKYINRFIYKLFRWRTKSLLVVLKRHRKEDLGKNKKSRQILQLQCVSITEISIYLTLLLLCVYVRLECKGDDGKTTLGSWFTVSKCDFQRFNSGL